MTGPNASSGEMPGFPFPRRPAPELDESLLDALLSGDSLPQDAPEQAWLLADMLASLASPAGPGALAGEAAARSAFARAASPAGISAPARQPARRKSRWLPAPLTARLAAALVATTVGLGGAAAAAYGGVLPGPIQELAHRVIGAPPAHRLAPHPRGHPDPVAVHRAAARLCVTYRRDASRGNAAAAAADLAKLTRDAGGAAKISGYCTAVHEPVGLARGYGAHPGKSGKATSHGNAKRHTPPRRHRAPRRAVLPIRPLH